LANSRPKPWPYMEKGYNNFHCFIDKTMKRFDENTKVVLVEGLPAVGKSAFAQELADELEMKYFPMSTLDSMYINAYGFDLRKLDDKIPARTRSFDEMRFLREPAHEQSILFQIHKLQFKMHQYFDAMAHLFNTGQGVVLDRSLYSDFIFAEAMYKCGYLNKDGWKAYYKFYDSCVKVAIKPHLVIYLDVPIPTVMDNIKKRNIPNESKTVNEKFLETLEESYKLKFLRDIETHSELLVYDWTEPGDTEVIVEDIERIDFDVHDEDIHNPKMMDWRFRKEWDAVEKRWEFTDQKINLITPCFMHSVLHIPALVADGNEMNEYYRVVDETPGLKFDYGFNPSMGDPYLWKLTRKIKFPASGTHTSFS